MTVFFKNCTTKIFMGVSQDRHGHYKVNTRCYTCTNDVSGICEMSDVEPSFDRNTQKCDPVCPVGNIQVLLRLLFNLSSFDLILHCWKFSNFSHFVLFPVFCFHCIPLIFLLSFPHLTKSRFLALFPFHDLSPMVYLFMSLIFPVLYYCLFVTMLTILWMFLFLIVFLSLRP